MYSPLPTAPALVYLATTLLGQADEIRVERPAAEPPRPLVPFRHPGKRIGRNAPCPCGSHKKFKACCRRAP